MQRYIALYGLAVALTAAFSGAPASGAEPARTHPDFTGGWALKNPVTQLPEVQPGVVATLRKNKDGVAKGDAEVDSSLNCLPLGFPRGMISTSLPLYILQSQQAVAIDGLAGGRPRVIYIGLNHNPNYWPTYMGDSIGHWEGDTLVVETVNFTDRTLMGPQGLPHSDEMRVLERIKLIDNGMTLEDQMQIEDKKVLKNPWRLRLDFQRRDDFRPAEHICETVHP